MIQAIHVDRFNLCQEGSTLNLLDGCFGPHGRACNQPFPIPVDRCANPQYANLYDSIITEHFFEWIRRVEFPHRTSRFQCWYGTDPADPDPFRWARRADFVNHPIWLLETEYADKLDSNLLGSYTYLNNQPYFNPDAMLKRARFYWAGKTMADFLLNENDTPESALPEPDWELLLKPPIFVRNRLP